MDSIDNSRLLYGRCGSRPYDECPIPLSPKILVNTLAEFADTRGFDVVALSLRTREVSIILNEYDNWDGGIWTWLITVPLLPNDWATFGGKEKRNLIENELTELANIVVVSVAHCFIVRIGVIPISPSTGITNQGRAHSDNPAPIEYDGLHFRSNPEVFLFIALRHTGLSVMPLPVVICNKARSKRIEPDFVIIHQGMTFIVEVDGDCWHRETPAEAQVRLSHLEDEGVIIIRVMAEDCNSTPKAKNAAKYVLSRIDKFLKSR